MIASTATNIAWIIAIILVFGWIVYALFNLRGVRPELGSEMELSPNRKPYYDDDDLEGKRLELVQIVGVVLLALIVIGLPLYWVFEPSRQAGARDAAEAQLERWGEALFATTAEGGFNCAGCHGPAGSGGSAEFTVTDPITGEARAVNWIAPALDTIFYRFDRDEVTDIITFGRPGTPMSAWGLDGGGPMNDQQVESLIEYLESVQVERENCAEEEADDPQLCPTGHLPTETQEQIEASARQAVEDGEYDSYGEALFNLDLDSGSYSCARCHTPGWSYGEVGESGQGSLGPNLTGGVTNTKFPNIEDMVAFVSEGSEQGVGYAEQSMGSGRMPGFGNMLTDEQIEAIVEYVRGL